MRLLINNAQSLYNLVYIKKINNICILENKILYNNIYIQKS